MIDLTPTWSVENKQPLYIQLYEYIKEEIKTGTIPYQTKMPSKRKLANYLNVSQNTVEAAYHQLVAEGYLESKARKGFYACKFEELKLEINTPFTNKAQEIFSQGKRYLYDFTQNGVDSQHFPFDKIRKLYNEVLNEQSSSLLDIGHPQGELSLRNEIAKYLFQSRGVRCSPSQIIIGAGTQYLISLLSQMLPKHSFAMEEPGYYRVLFAWKNHHSQVKTIPLDENGIHISLLEKSQANIVYVTPSHQFPVGMVMPISKRNQLLNWAELADDRFIIEDDYDSEFRYTGKPIPALQGLDQKGKVIYISTFSKGLMPSLRVAFMVLPMPLLEHYQVHFSLYNQTVSKLDQEVLKRFLENGGWEKHLSRMRTIYRKKRDALVHAIQLHFQDKVEIIGQEAGLHVLLKVYHHLNEKQLINLAAEKGANVYPASIYFAHSYPLDGSILLLLGFASLTIEEMEQAIPLLKDAWFPVRKAQAPV